MPPQFKCRGAVAPIVENFVRSTSAFCTIVAEIALDQIHLLSAAGADDLTMPDTEAALHTEVIFILDVGAAAVFVEYAIITGEIIPLSDVIE